MEILAIDPGHKQSAYVLIGTPGYVLIEQGILPNDELLIWVRDIAAPDVITIEMIKSYGNVMGDSVIETCVWIGRFIQASGKGDAVDLLPRKTVVTQICNNPRAKDSNVRQALIDRYGGAGAEKKGGPLEGVKKDIWSALAVAIAWHEIKFQQKDQLKRALQ